MFCHGVFLSFRWVYGCFWVLISDEKKVLSLALDWLLSCAAGTLLPREWAGTLVVASALLALVLAKVGVVAGVLRGWCSGILTPSVALFRVAEDQGSCIFFGGAFSPEDGRRLRSDFLDLVWVNLPG